MILELKMNQTKNANGKSLLARAKEFVAQPAYVA